ncbi:MAG TPA: ABC transporter permease [bacterium]|nr:ABC transporter permease [bacterium]HMW34223.1 ABC transporter permease [bacterium]HMY35941.1 ABC transporter permease [bacterium]HMZ05247.1 ABC transporter permease [bacterium]HNB09231.1 ABC transporter permease [bacterium]
MLFKMMLRNALRHKLRTILTILGIAIAVGAFGLLRTVITSWYAAVEAAAVDRLITRQAVSFIFPLPYAYRDQILKVPGVEKVGYFNWFQGVYKDKSEFFPRMACDPETIFDVYPEFLVTPEEKAAFQKERNACVVGADIAKKHNLKIGDVMSIEGDIYPGRWEFVVRAIYQPKTPAIDATQMFFHWTYLDERMKQDMPGREGNVGWYAVKIKDPSESAAVSEAIDAIFKNSNAETKTETERAFNQGFIGAYGAIINGINIMAFMIIGIILLVLANTMIMSARERNREYAVMKTLGFTGKHIFGVVTGESIIIGILGGIAGYAVTLFFVGAFSVAVPKNFFPVFILADITVIQEFSFAVIVGILAGIIPVVQAIKTDIVDGLRYVG